MISLCGEIPICIARKSEIEQPIVGQQMTMRFCHLRVCAGKTIDYTRIEIVGVYLYNVSAKDLHCAMTHFASYDTYDCCKAVLHSTHRECHKNKIMR